ncbi:ATP-grasp domain-containing protein [Micromonospora coerulea]|uniref:ATP-grasp domain-containing protein n=1 Tax=Micromonospora coerulea TaxID=47856 RepID=UPI001908A402|nr:ATP-grasp domain-containing protein [Micromonospora veneta]
MRLALVGFGEGRAKALARSAAELGLEVVVFEDPDVCRKRRVDERAADYPMITKVVAARYVSSDDMVEAIVAEHKNDPFDAVSPGLEYTVVEAARAAERLGLRGAGTDAARLLRDKLLLRARAQEDGIANPRWQEVHDARQIAAFAAGADRIVLKPANRQASLGVQILSAGDDLDSAWAETVAADEQTLIPDEPPRWRFMVEDLVVGEEFSVELLVDRGRTVFGNTTGKAVQAGRYPVELGHTVPAPISDTLGAKLVAATEALAEAIGYDTGVLHAEWIVADGEPVLVECAGRLPGDSIVDLIDHAYGTDLSAALLRLLAGQELCLPRRAQAAAAIRFLSVPPGVVYAVEGAGLAEGSAGVVRCIVKVKPGDRVTPARSSWERSGHVIALGGTPSEASSRAEAAANLVRIRTT